MTNNSERKPVVRRSLGLATVISAGLLTALVGTAIADPVGDAPGSYPTTNSTGGTPTATDFITAVGADADAELVNEIAKQYNTTVTTGAKVLSYDAVNPTTGTAGETIHVKPGCDLVRPNGANAGITAIKANQLSSASTLNPQAGDGAAPCVDFVRSSRGKAASGESAYTFYDLTRDAVTWATIGGSYAPASLTTLQLRGIFECAITNWAQVGGQYGPIHVYAQPSSAATYTFFLTSISSSVAAVTAGCGSSARLTQQNDGTKIAGDPLGITPYAVTKWAAQLNQAPGINDLRGGAVLGQVPLSDGTTLVTPTVPYKTTGFQVLNPDFASGTGGLTSTQGRLLYNVTRNGSALSSLFDVAGFVCTHEDELLPQFGAIPLGTDTSKSEYCGKAN